MSGSGEPGPRDRPTEPNPSEQGPEARGPSADGPQAGPGASNPSPDEIPLKKLEGGEYGEASMQSEATQLMTAAKNGDGEAFDHLVERLRGRAFFVAQSLVGSREDALELSQEAFLKTYRARDTYRDGEPFLPWFHRILRNTCFTFLRRHGRLKKRSLSDAFGSEEEGADWDIADENVEQPHERLEGRERSAMFWRAFRTLSAKDREILALRHFKELAYQEIADTLDIPVGTVMSRLFHARRRLRDALASDLELLSSNKSEDVAQ